MCSEFSLSLERRICSGAHLHSLSFMTTHTTALGTTVPSNCFDSVPSTMPGPYHAPLWMPVLYEP